MGNIGSAIHDNWPYFLLAFLMVVAGGAIIAVLFFRLKAEIKLSRRIEALTGHVVTEEATAILKRMRDTSTEDTMLRILPTLAGTQKALRQTGLKIDLVGYAGAILIISAATALFWDNPLVPSMADASEPIVTAVLLHIILSTTIIAMIVRRRKAKLLKQLSQTVSHVSRSLQAGQTIDAAIALAAKSTPNPLQRELHDVIKLSSVGVPAAEALRAVSPNIDLPEFDFFISAIEASDRSGGNLSRVLGELVGVIRARNQLKLKVDALTAEGKMSAVVLALLPIGIFGWLCFSNPSYVEPLFEREAGQIIMGLAFFLIFFGVAVMLRMVRLKV